MPHTHWDREWYAPYQTFRLRLVHLLDELLPRLDADASYAHFLLDGQMAVVDDYLAVRPEHEATLRRLATAGRLAMGPWYILMDEFLVSGETIVRDLELGLSKAAAFGGAMPVGYLPDMFGHVTQMPQILAQFGFDHAVVWRGVPAAITASAFWWEAPNGATVRAEYLPTGYGNGAAIPDDAKALVERIEGWIADHHHLVGDDAPILWMNGTDHQVPQAWLGRVVAEANAIAQPALRLEVTSLPAYLATAPTEGLPRWRGELRSGARANLLMGVTSNRTDVRRAAAAAERALEQLAEPLNALFLPEHLWPAALLDEAWLAVIRNAAHDSICACSHDEVVDAVLSRFAEARHIGRGLADHALAIVGALTSAKGPVIVNPSARTRGGVVTVELPLERPPEGTQLVQQRPAEVHLHTVAIADAPVIVERELDINPTIHAVEIVDDAPSGAVVVHLRADPRLAGRLVPSAVRRQLADLAAARSGATVEIWLHQQPQVTVLTRVERVPGFGWSALASTPSPSAAVSVATTTMTNELVSVAVDPSDGTWSIDRHRGLGRLVNGGDAGDTYNYCPPDHDVIVDAPTTVEIEPVATGPVVGRLRIRATYSWPTHVDDASSARVGSAEVVVTTTLELRAGERLVRVTTELDNACRDHRLRVHFPLPDPADCSHAECAFAIVERGLTAEGGPTELGLPTFPAKRFVMAGGLTVVHDGVTEYELIDVVGAKASTLALTLLRANRFLSRGPMPYRPLPAGPQDELEGSQMLGHQRAGYAVHVGYANPYALADDVLVPLEVTRGAGLGTAPPTFQALELEGAEVSAVRRVGGALHVRLFNPSPSPTTVRLGERRGWVLDLRGRPQRRFDGPFTLGPWDIATASIEP